MTNEELCIRACKYAINELTRKGSSAFITSAHEGRQQISWIEVVEWLNELEVVAENTTSDCISRQAVLDRAKDYGSGTFLIPVNAVKELPSVNPQEPKTGWIDMGDGEYKCPKCHKEFINGMDIENMTKFFPKCPNCGCRMEK